MRAVSRDDASSSHVIAKISAGLRGPAALVRAPVCAGLLALLLLAPFELKGKGFLFEGGMSIGMELGVYDSTKMRTSMNPIYNPSTRIKRIGRTNGSLLPGQGLQNQWYMFHGDEPPFLFFLEKGCRPEFNRLST